MTLLGAAKEGECLENTPWCTRETSELLEVGWDIVWHCVYLAGKLGATNDGHASEGFFLSFACFLNILLCAKDCGLESFCAAK